MNGNILNLTRMQNKKAKKSVVKYASISIKQKDSDTSNMKIYGRNSNDTIIEINVELDDWNFPGLIKQMVEIAKERVRISEIKLANIKEAINS